MEAVVGSGGSGSQVWNRGFGKLDGFGNLERWSWPSGSRVSSFCKYGVRRTIVTPSVSWTSSCCTGNVHTRGPFGKFTVEESPLGNSASAIKPSVMENLCSNAGDHAEGFDVLLLSNGPGEVTTWVRPVVMALRQNSQKMNRFRISVVLAPCPHASGAELELVRSFGEVDRCQGPESFWKLLVLGSTKDGWKWYKRGVCIFLGGDQAYALLLGRRFGYKVIMYAEDAVRWPGIAHKYMLRSEELMRQVPNWAKSSCAVVGDLFWDAVGSTQGPRLPVVNNKLSASACCPPPSFANFRAEMILEDQTVPVVGLLPGSKESKLALGVPYFMAVAAQVHNLMDGRVRFVLPLAPTATLDMLRIHADAHFNPFISQLGWSSGSVTRNFNARAGYLGSRETNDGKREHPSGALAHLVTNGGVRIEIWQAFPAHDLFKLCNLCLTTVGTNTAELGLLGIPMLVILPTHALQVFKGGTGGLLGLLAKAPGWAGRSVTQTVNLAILKAAGYLAWPNRWAGEEVVPEFVGRIEPTEIAAITAHYLTCEEKLLRMRQRLFDVSEQHFGKSAAIPGSPGVTCPPAGGAAEAIAAEVTRMAAS